MLKAAHKMQCTHRRVQALVRTSLLAGLCFLLFLTVGSRVAAQSSPLVRVVTAPTDMGAQVFYAQDLGLFKQAGLDVQISTIPNGAATLAAIASGADDIGQTNIVSLAVAHERRLPFVIVAPAGVYSSKNPTTMLAVLKNSPLHTAKDLNGKIIAVPGVRSLTDIATEAWVDENGGDGASLKFVEIPFSLVVPALQSARVDAAVLSDPFLGVALANGTAREVAPILDAVGDTFLLAAYISTDDFARTHPELIRRFAAVMSATARWANTHQRESAQILERWTKQKLLGAAARVTYADQLRTELVQPLIDTSAKYGVLKSSFPASELLPAASAAHP